MSGNRSLPDHEVTNLVEEIWKTIEPFPPLPAGLEKFHDSFFFFSLFSFFLFFFFPRSRGNNERWKSGIERATTYDNNEGGISIRVAAFIAIRYATVQRNCGLSCDSKKKKRREKHFSKKKVVVNQSDQSLPEFEEGGGGAKRGEATRDYSHPVSPPGVINDRTLTRLGWGRESSGIDQTNRINLERLLSGWNDPDRETRRIIQFLFSSISLFVTDTLPRWSFLRHPISDFRIWKLERYLSRNFTADRSRSSFFPKNFLEISIENFHFDLIPTWEKETIEMLLISYRFSFDFLSCKRCIRVPFVYNR